MPDIFISYSRKDSEQAQLLTELLASAGLSVWIDHSSIGAATSWSGEISKAITDCTALIVLLSPSSVDSKNVTREVALAFERNKKILPIDIEPVILPDDFAYHLAGLQRSSMTNIDAIIRALSKLGLEATGAPQAPKIVKESDDKKSLMILPFEDLSPTGDNQWFADGLASELISVLSNVEALRITDWNTSKLLKERKVKTTELAKELEVRYFVEGQVRKFGDQIKISVTLLDIETGDHLWQDSMKGTMTDVFEIQEQMAVKVVGGLKVHLASDEEQKLRTRGTTNDEAYALAMKEREYAGRNTREGYLFSADLLTEAIALDPTYAYAMTEKAGTLTALFRGYDRTAALLVEAERLAHESLRIKPDQHAAFANLADVYRLQGKLDQAEEAALEYVRRAPQNPDSHSALGFFYLETNQPLRAIPHYERSIELNPNFLYAYMSVCIACHSAGDTERQERWAVAALPYFEKRLRLAPDDENIRVLYANLLEYAGRREQAVQALTPLEGKRDLDSISLYNIASMYGRLDHPEQALDYLRRAIRAGFRYIELLNTDPDLDALRDTGDFAELLKELEGRQNA